MTIERATLYHILDGNFVDLERRSERLIVRRGTLNGPFVTETDPRSIDEIVAHYQALGYRRGTPWGFGLFGHASRQLVKRPVYACFSVVGAELRTSGGEAWYSNLEKVQCASEAEAIAKAEALLAEREAEGYELYNFELLNPTVAEVTTEVTRSATAYDAVDRAITMLRVLTREYAFGHFLVEDVTRDAPVLAALGYDASNSHGRYFQEMHAEKFARWHTDPGEVPRTGSSFEYFLKRWGTVTWIVDSAVDDGLPMFYCSNVSGGGWCALELGTDLGDASVYADDRPGHGYDTALCFHGGWGRTGYIFDRRVASPTGEWAIYPLCLDGEQPDDPPADSELPDPASIEPFGFWLERHVHELVETLRPRLDAIR